MQALYRSPCGHGVLLVVDRCLAVLTRLLVGAWIARYLGPERFGTFSYALALVSLFGTAAALGLDPIARRELTVRPSERQETLRTLLSLRLMGGFAALVLVLVTSCLLPIGGPGTRMLLAILSVRTLLQPFEVIRVLFECRMRMATFVLATQAGLVLSSAVKLGLVFCRAPLGAFAAAMVVEAALAATAMVAVYRLSEGRWPLGWGRLQGASGFLAEGCLLLLSSIALTSYVKVDQVMVLMLAGEAESGIYAAAGRLYEAWLFLPVVIVAACYAPVVSARSTSRPLYHRRLQQLFSLMTVAAVGIAAPVAAFSPLIIHCLFGQRYAASAPVLAILIWTLVGAFHGCALRHWFVVEGRSQCFLWRAAGGALLNGLLNAVLIPSLGAVGAAMATLVAYTYVAVIGNAFSRVTWPVFRSQVRFPLVLAQLGGRFARAAHGS